MKKYLTVLTILTLVAVLAVGCAGMPPLIPGQTQTSPLTSASPGNLPAGKGVLEVRVTDPPPPEMAHIWVEIENLEVHRTGGSWTTIAVDTEPFDLKAIEGIEEFLASQVVEAGKYTQIRLDVPTVTIEDKDGNTYPARVPSEKIKLVGNFEVPEGGQAVITLDFNGQKSVLVTGNDKYMFKPVIKLLVSGEEEGALEITTTSLPNGAVGTAYSATVEASGGATPYTWSKTAGDLPPDLTLDPDGDIGGTPTTAGTYTFTVEVKDSSDPQQTAAKELSISIVAAGELVITTTSLPEAQKGVAYTATLEFIGGTGPYTWSISSGHLPAGLDIDTATGVIAGTPQPKKGDYDFEVQLKDSSDPQKSDTQELSIHIKG